MPPPREVDLLRDILSSARAALAYVSGKTESDLLRDAFLQDAVVRRFEIMGEAAKRIGMQTRTQYPQLPWKYMTGMRDHLAHEYDDVDYSLLWHTIQEDLPPLVAALEKIVPPGSPP